MVRIRHILSGCVLTACASVVAAQSYPRASYPQTTYPQPNYPQTPYPAPNNNAFALVSDADQLAQQMRSLAADPTNVYALVNAGNLSLKLGDTDGAAALFTRAERVAPTNPQVKAGMARLLVNAQRPGEALRLFQDAAAMGAGDRDFGSDRALAYDLIGDQARAQREYRALLRRGADDEATRRYALSLGISGLKDPALALLDPLNRRGDRGAWRARAFVLAMNGDRAGAERIAVTMMPPGMADGLRLFFDRLPRLPATDRAFAVHFGEVRTNAARVVDARRIPALPALAPEPNPFPPTRAASVAVAAADTDKKRKRNKRLADPVRLAAAPYVAPLPSPPAPTATQLASLGANRMVPPPEAYGPATPSRGVTILPPPADAYRSPSALAPAQPTRVAQAALPSAVTRVTSTALPPSATAEGDDEGPDEVVAPPAAVTQAVAAPPKAATTPAVAAPVQLAGTSFALQPSTGLDVTTGRGTPAPIGVPSPSPSLALPAAVPSTSAASGVQSQLPQLQPSSVSPSSSPLPAPSFSSAPVPLSTPTASQSAATQVSRPVVAPPVAAQVVATPVVAPPVAAAAAPLVVPPPVGAQGDAVLAAIVANITVPETELRSAPAREAPLLTNVEKQADPVTRLAPSVAVAPREKPVAKERPVAKGIIAGKDVPDPTTPAKDARGRFLDAKGKPLLDVRGRPMDARTAAAWIAAHPVVDKEATTDPALPAKDARGRFVDAKGKPLLDTRGRPMDAKAAAAWKLADAKKPAESKKKVDPAKDEPERIWVQVAGGANEDTLGKEWVRVSGQAAALKGRQGWTTPLRATNRILTGPFKTGAEAMALVNLLKKQNVSAFMFTSDPGQKITRLPAK